MAMDKCFRALSQKPLEAWRKNSQQHAFLLPQSIPRHHTRLVTKYGTSKAAAIVEGGGPAMLKDCADLPELLLRRLSFFDSGMNTDMEEALQVFANATMNKRALRALKIELTEEKTTQATLSKLRSVFLADSWHGEWQIAPSDQSVRNFLFSKQFLSRKGAERTEVFEAMKKYADRAALPKKHTYNAYVSDILSHLNANHPSKRF
eukprot:TRINITY_DN27891_c1_g1_i1.p1 TRINITY_DN27891_c1_g1~~TRINITY_DN27891_c1_g1_i1.p1  ORF type:complete len:240 (-),score=28.38 TRINITY_DN27891_c1_g1_i1:350-964(-)